MKLLLAFSVLVLCAVPARAQFGSTVGSGGSINQSGGLGAVSFPYLSSNPPTQFRILVATGSDAGFVPSAFLPFTRAVAVGDSSSSAAVFMEYRQAVAAGVAELAAKQKSLAQVARENRSKDRPKSAIAFVQDQSGRLVRQSD
jgi:hypothetical protein